MPTYSELKQELSEIGRILEKFPDDVKSKVFDLLVNEFYGSTEKKTISQENKLSLTSGKNNESKEISKKGKKNTGNESYSLDRDLNLRGDKSIPSFKEFYNSKNPKNAKETNTVAVYYLKKLLGMELVKLDHIYTCYHEVNEKPPTAFRQSFIDTKNKKGWLEFDSDGNLLIPHRGVVFVEHDLPHTSGKDEK